MELDTQTGSLGGYPTHLFDSEQQEIDSHIKLLYDKRQRILTELQTNPYHQREMESQLNAINQDIQFYQQHSGGGMHPLTPNTSNPITPTTMDSAMFHNGYNGSSNNGGKQGQFISPVDSAFVSGVTTKAPSIVGDMEDLETLPDDYPPNATVTHGMPQGPPPPLQRPHLPPHSQYDQYNEHQAIANDQIMQSSGDRVRITMFPEATSEGEEIPNTQIVPERQSNLQRMSQSSQIMKAAVQNLVNYQSNTELTAQALPEIISLLSHQDQSIAVEASKLIHDLSKKEASLAAINASSHAVRAIIETLANINNGEIQKLLAGAVHNMSSNSQGLLMIYNSNGIPFLVRLLTSSVDAVLFYAVTTIHNMLLHFEPAKMDVRLAGGLEKMVGLLVKDNVKFLAITTDCLHILAYGHQDSKLIILASNGPALLVRIMKIYTYEKLLWTVSRLLKALSVCSSNKPKIVEAGGMQVLSLHLSHRSSRLVQNILFTLRNLSDYATKQDNLDELLHQLIGLLSSTDINCLTCTAGVLSNLTCNNAKNKTIVCQYHGVEALLRAIGSNSDKTEVIERCVCSLRHITSRHPYATMAQNGIRELNGIPMLMNLLQPQTRYPMIKALIGLFRNLAIVQENHTVLREQGCIPKLWQLLNRSFQELQRRANQPGMASGIVDGVSMNEVVECSAAVLHFLARDPSNRIIMRQLNVIPMFVQLLYMRNEGIQRVAVGALSELAIDPEGAEQIEREGAPTPLNDLLHSHNEAIAAYSAAVLFCLSGDKHEGFTPRLPTAAGRINYRQELGMDSHSPAAGYYPMLPSMRHYSNPGSVPGSQPFTPTMSEPQSGLMTPHSEFELPLDFDDYSHPGSGFHSSHHSGVHTPNHPHSGHHSAIHTPGHHSGVHTPNHPHSGVHTPNHPHSGVHTPNHPHSGVHTPNHYPPTMSYPPPAMQPQHIPQPPPPHLINNYGAPPPHHQGMGPGYYRVQQQTSYNPPSPALMDTAGGGTVWLDTDL